MNEQPQGSPELTKYPNPEKANSHIGGHDLPGAFKLFSPSVAVLKRNMAALLLLGGVPLLLTLVGQGTDLFQPTSTDDPASLELFHGPLAWMGSLGSLLFLIATPGFIVAQLKGVRNESIAWDAALREGLKHFWRFLGLSILTAIILIAGLLLLIVPFFILLPRVFLSVYFLIDRKMGIIEALKASFAAYRQHGGVWGIIGVTVLLGLIGIVPVIGTIISSVVLLVYASAPAIRYLQIEALSHQKPPRTPIEATLTASQA